MTKTGTVLATVFAVCSMAVLFGMYHHSEKIRQDYQLRLKDRDLELLQASRRLEMQFEEYKDDISKSFQRRKLSLKSQISSESDNAISKLSQHLQTSTSDVKLELHTVAAAPQQRSRNRQRRRTEVVPNTPYYPERRGLALRDQASDFTAILVNSDSASIKMGASGDTDLYRKSMKTLQTDGNLIVGGALKFGDAEEITVTNQNQKVTINGDVVVRGILSADQLKTNYSHLSYTFPVGEAISKGDVVSLVAGKLRKGFGVGIGVTDVFSSGAAHVKVFYLTKDKFIATYKASDSGYAVVGSVDGTGKVSIGSPSRFDTSVQDNQFSLAATSATRLAVVWKQKHSSNHYCYAKVGTISTLTLTWGSKKNTLSTQCQFPAATNLGNDKFGVIYKNPSSSSGMGLIGKIADGENINFGSAESFHAFDVKELSISRLKDDQAFFGFIDVSKNSRTMAVVFNARGTEVSFNSKKEISPLKSTFVSVTGAGSGKAGVAYRTEVGEARITLVDIVNGYIEPGSSITFDTALGMYPDISIAGLGSDRILITYRDILGYGKLIDGDVVGKMVFLGRTQTFAATPAASASTTSIGTRWVVAYQDTKDSNKGKVQVISQWGGARALGISKESTNTGQVEVVLQGVVDAFNAGSFSSGGVYYAKNNGQISATDGVSLGRALTDSLLLLENLASQNEISLGGESGGGGGGSRRMMARKCTSSMSNGHWIPWNTELFATKDAFRYTNRRIYFNEEGIFHFAMMYNVQGSADRNNRFYLYVQGDRKMQTWEHSNGGWRHTLRCHDNIQVKKDWWLSTQLHWAHGNYGYQGNEYGSRLSLVEIQNTFAPEKK